MRRLNIESIKQKILESSVTRGNIFALLEAVELPEMLLVDGKQRPTKNSNGKPINSKIEYIENFWRWFGDSKVVDSQGRPHVYLHGTATPNISEFSGNRSYAGHFTLDSTFSEDFSNSRASEEEENGSDGYAQTYGVYLKCINIFDARNEQHINKLPKNVIRGNSRDFSFLETNAKYIKYAGFDAVHDYENDEWESTGIAVFSPNQIKSATGNNGQYGDSANILTESISSGIENLPDEKYYDLDDELMKNTKKPVEDIIQGWKNVDNNYYGIEEDYDKLEQKAHGFSRGMNANILTILR